MAGLADTIARLRGKNQSGSHASERLAPLGDFGPNPGALRGWCYIPLANSSPAALVVVLHGCTQDASGYDRGSGWSKLAEEHGFAVLFPEQQRANNPNACFNWFNSEDISRGSGEASSIRQMIDAMCRRHSIDASRIYVTGLSAGGAMAGVMLATYPELFAGGAIIAGLPFGIAHGVPQALERMRGQGLPGTETLGRLVRRASRHAGPWPTISVWHGSSDRTVDVSNAQAIVDQWRELHGAVSLPDQSDQVEGYPHRAWHDGAGRTVIEDYRITGLGHGTPLSTRGPEPCGVAGPFMLEAGISSTMHIARAWRLLEGRGEARAGNLDTAGQAFETHPPTPANEVGAVIEQALRAAGLMR